MNIAYDNIRLLKENFALLTRSFDSLKLSVAKADKIIGKGAYSFEEMETFDSLTSKFNRTSDIYTQKVLRTVWALLHEPFMPFIDMMNKAEKMELISSSDEMLIIRDLRNQISHEYFPEAIQEIVPEVISYSKKLENNIELTKHFLTIRDWI